MARKKTRAKASTGSQHWKDPFVRRSITTRLTQAAGLIIIGISVYGGWLSITRETPVEIAEAAAEEAAAAAVSRMQAQQGPPGGASLLVTQTSLEYLRLWLTGAQTSHLTLEEYPAAGTGYANVSNPQLENFTIGGTPHPDGQLYQVTASAYVDNNKRWYTFFVLYSAGRAWVASAGQEINSVEYDRPANAWTFGWDNDPPDGLMNDLQHFFNAWLAGNERLDPWVTPESNLVASLAYEGSNVRLLDAAGVPIAEGGMMVRALVIIDNGPPYEFVLRALLEGRTTWAVSEIYAAPIQRTP